MPGLDVCAAGISRKRSALLFEKGNQAAAAQAGIYFGRGAVGVRIIVGWAKRSVPTRSDGGGHGAKCAPLPTLRFRRLARMERSAIRVNSIRFHDSPGFRSAPSRLRLNAPP